MDAFIDAPSISTPLKEVNMAKPGANKPARANNMMPVGFKLLNGTNKRERTQNTTVPIKVTITMAEITFDFTNPLLTRTIPKPKRKADERANNSDSTTTTSHIWFGTVS